MGMHVDPETGVITFVPDFAPEMMSTSIDEGVTAAFTSRMVADCLQEAWLAVWEQTGRTPRDIHQLTSKGALREREVPQVANFAREGAFAAHLASFLNAAVRRRAQAEAAILPD